MYVRLACSFPTVCCLALHRSVRIKLLSRLFCRKLIGNARMSSNGYFLGIEAITCTNP